jgi:hypothetical protein
MQMKCFTCGKKISKTWLFQRLPGSKYTCPQCGSTFAGTNPRMLLTTIVAGVLGYVAIQVIKGKMSFFLLLPIVFLTVILFLAELLKQIKRIDEKQ